MADSPVLQLAKALIARPSVTPADEGCQTLLADRLRPSAFSCETLPFGDVRNLWARRGTGVPLFVFAGHTDVVPAGPLDKWRSNPFQPAERDGRLYGRGAADMKGSIAAFVVAAEEFIAARPIHTGSIGLILTSDEEGPAIHGTTKVCDTLAERGERLDYCIVGEPTSVATPGDTIKNGRRGSLSGRLVVKGVQGHVAYPHLARNPIHELAPALTELTQTQWDSGNDYFPATTFQVSNVHAGTGAGNVIPGQAVVDFNLRFASSSTPDSIEARIEDILHRHRLDFELVWTLNARPFLTERGELSRAVTEAIRAETGIEPELSTTGGTSDGRFLTRICKQVMELGPENATIHQVDENVPTKSLDTLKNIYRRTLELLLPDGAAHV